MKKLLSLTLLVVAFTGGNAFAQKDKSNRASPPASVTETLSSGAVVTINYSQPSLKNRTIGKDIVPYGKVWRTGANEATTFEISKNVKIEGKLLPAGKYSLYTIPGEKEWTVIFNKTWDQWGNAYSEAEDALRVVVKPETTETDREKFTFLISKNGEVSMEWGKTEVEFEVK